MVYEVTLLSILSFYVWGRSLIKKKQWKELCLMVVFLLLAITYALDISLELNRMPSLSVLLSKIAPLASAFSSYFQVY